MKNTGISQHKQMAMNFKKGGSVKPPMNFSPSPKAPAPPPKDGFSETPTEKVKRINGVKGV